MAAGRPAPPRNLIAVGGDRQATLSWDEPVSNGGSAITKYEYRHAVENAALEYTDWMPNGTDRRVTVDGLMNRQRYRFEVRAVVRSALSLDLEELPPPCERV